MAILPWTLGVLSALLAVFTALPMTPIEHWSVRGLDFPRLQLSAVLAAAWVAEIISLDVLSVPGSAILALTSACLLYQAWWITPYTPLWRKEVHAARPGGGPTISILTSNVLMDNRDAQPLLKAVRRERPDVLVTLETDRWWQQQLAILEKDYPHRLACPLPNRYGMHLYSKLPLHDAKTEFLVENDKPSMHAAIELQDGRRIRAHFLHPAPPSPTENEASTERDTELLLVGRAVADAELPVIVTGDLNDVAWSRTTRAFRRISGLLDPRVGRGMFNTFHADYWYLRWPLDHLFHSRDFTLVEMRRLESVGSDHFPLFTQLALTPVEGRKQEGLDAADAEDLDWQREKAREAGVSVSAVPNPEARL